MLPRLLTSGDLVESIPTPASAFATGSLDAVRLRPAGVAARLWLRYHLTVTSRPVRGLRISVPRVVHCHCT